MKIITCVRTRDESSNIYRFIDGYTPWVDEIIIADGGSRDDTVSKAALRKMMTKDQIFIEHFWTRVQGKNGLWRNPEGAHMQFLFDKAKEHGADWIINTECDAFPTMEMKKNGRKLFEEADKAGADVILAYYIYMWGSDNYFPDLNIPGPGMYAFRASSDIRMSLADPWNVDFLNMPKEVTKYYRIEKPNAILHCFCPDVETTERKLKFYRESGQQPNCNHPLEADGPLAPLEDWMIE